MEMGVFSQLWPVDQRLTVGLGLPTTQQTVGAKPAWLYTLRWMCYHLTYSQDEMTRGCQSLGLSFYELDNSEILEAAFWCSNCRHAAIAVVSSLHTR